MTRSDEAGPTREGPSHQTSVSGRHELVLIEATVARAPRRVRWLVVAAMLASGLGLVFAVREVSRTERALVAEGARAVRVVMYELRPGADFRVPIEPETDVVRVVVHATGRGALAREGHVVRLGVDLRGTLGSRSEALVVTAPGTNERVTPEDRELTVGDPIAVNIDVGGIGTGELVLKLASIEGAETLLVRVYRREAVRDFDATRRRATIDDDRRARFARRAGEIDWIDLEPTEQSALVGARWRKVGALGDSTVVSRAVALAPPRPIRPRPDDVMLGTVVLRAAERVSVVARGASSITARATGHPATKLVATVVEENGEKRLVEGHGEVRIQTEEGRAVAVEVESDEPHAITVFASDLSSVAVPETAHYWRTTQERPVVIRAGPLPTVLRVSVRRPSSRSGGEALSFTMTTTIAAPAAARTTTTRIFTTKRSEVDRYEGRDPALAPSERTVFFVLVPSNATAELAPADGAVDVHIAELDSRAAPQAALAHVDSPRLREAGVTDWEGWVARRPTNAAAFPAEAQPALRIAHRFVVPGPLPPHRSDLRVARPGLPALRHDGALFAQADVSFAFDVPDGGPFVLPFRLMAKGRVNVVAHIDDVTPRRRTSGAFATLTSPRTVSVDGDTRSAVVLGDDLQPGRHVITFTATPEAKLWVHLPWKMRPPHAPGPRWITGDFEP